MNSPARERKTVLAGRLSDFDVASLLQVMSTGRQHTMLEVLDLNGERAGAIYLKSGKVLSAEAGELDGLPAVRELLAAPSIFGFVVYRQPQTVVALPLLGSVGDVLLRASAPNPPSSAGRSGVHRTVPPPPPLPARLDEVASTDADERALAAEPDPDEITKVADRRSVAQRESSVQPVPAEVKVLDGRFSEFDLSSVLQVAGLSRQHTSVRIFDEQRQLAGEIHLQSGHVLSVDGYEQQGIDALRLLLHSPRDFGFEVSRHTDQIARHRRAIGTVTELLQAASTLSAQAQTADAPQFQPQAGSLVPAARSDRTPKILASVVFGLLAAGTSFWIGGQLRSYQVAREHAVVAQPASANDVAAAPPTPVATPLAAHDTEPAEDSLEQETLQHRDLLGAAAVGSFQGGLKLLGFHPGPIDGVVGPLTRAAVAEFQRAEDLPVDGELSLVTQARLAKRIGGRAAAFAK